jgi:hypothetical protein
MTKIKGPGKVTGRGGDPYINLCLAVLGEAKQGDSKMWQDFKKEHDITKSHPGAFGIALWVSQWWQKDLKEINKEDKWIKKQ